MTNEDTKELAAHVDNLRSTQTAINLWKEKCPNAQTIVYAINSEHAHHVTEMINKEHSREFFDIPRAFCMVLKSSKSKRVAAYWFNKRAFQVLVFVSKPVVLDVIGIKCVLDLRPKSRQMIITLLDGDKQFWKWDIETELDGLTNNMLEVSK